MKHSIGVWVIVGIILIICVVGFVVFNQPIKDTSKFTLSNVISNASDTNMSN